MGEKMDHLRRFFPFTKRSGATAVIVVFSTLTWISIAAAIDFLEGNLNVHGKMVALIGMHTQDADFGGPDFDAGDPSEAQFIGDLEASYAPNDILRFSAIGRLFKEEVYDITDAYDSSFHPSGRGFLDPFGNYSKTFNRHSPDWGRDVRLREAFADINLGRFGTARLGKQQITWGESDGLRLADIINPLNISRHFIMEEWEDIRIPIWAIYGNFKAPLSWMNDFTFDLLYTQDFERAIRAEPGSGAAWAFPIPNAARGPNPWNADMMPYFVQDEPSKSPSSAEYGIRIRYKSPLAGIEFSGFYYQTISDTPVLDFRGEFAPPPAPAPPIPGPGGTFLPIIFLVYEKYDVLGGTFNFFNEYLKTVFRGEFTVYLDYPFNAIDPDANLLGIGIKQKNQWRGMLGFDRQVFVPFLNPHKSFFVSGQYFFFWTPDAEAAKLIDSTYNDQGIHEKVQVLTLKVNTGYLMEKLVPDILVIYSPDHKWWQLRPSLTYTTTSMQWHYALGANYQGGPNEFDEMGLFKRHGEVYFQIKYTF
jgi:hypothetical protein